MKPTRLAAAMLITVCALADAARADVAIVIEHQWTIGNNYFSCFAYNSLLDPHEFITTGYGSGKDLRWSRVLDDTDEPWVMEGEVLMGPAQIEFFARDGYASYSLSYNAWGMAFNPLDQKYFIGCISVLRDPFSGNERVESERDMIQFDPRLPNGLPTRPTGVTVSSDGLLVDVTLISSNGFIASGVRVGDQLTLYPAHWSAEIYSGTYTIEEVVSEDTLRLDRDPLWAGSSTQVDNASYILMMQPWLTLKDFRDTIPYFDEDRSAGPKAHYKGGFSPDGNTYYVGEIIADNVLAVDTQTRGNFSIFVSKETMADYIQSEIDSGRNFAIHPFTDVIYGDGLRSGWSNQSVGTTVNLDNTDPVWGGEGESIAATFHEAAAQLWFHATYDPEEGEVPRDASHYTNLEFQIHGGTVGGQEMTVTLADEFGTPGTPITVTPPEAGSWFHVRIPVSDFGVDTIGDIIWTNTAVGAQPRFFLDQVELVWVDPLPDGIYEHDIEDAGPGPAQVACDKHGLVWFSEGETDDILYTTDGVTLNVFLRSSDILAAYVDAGVLDPSDYSVSNAVQVMGLIVDPMGTVYWSDNQTDSIWKAPAENPAENIVQLATKAEIQEALSIGRSPRGMNNFTIRGMELLTFNYVDSNTVYKVDLDTQSFGDLDADFDADLEDYAFFQECMLFDVAADPEHLCSRCDLDGNDVVDLADYTQFAPFVVGPN